MLHLAWKRTEAHKLLLSCSLILTGNPNSSSNSSRIQRPRALLLAGVLALGIDEGFSRRREADRATTPAVRKLVGVGMLRGGVRREDETGVRAMRRVNEIGGRGRGGGGRAPCDDGQLRERARARGLVQR